MGKSRRKNKSKQGRVNPASRPEGARKLIASTDVEMTGTEEALVEETQTQQQETAGSMQKRHHVELKAWRREEADLRRQKHKLKGKDPETLKQKKELLKEIKQKNEELLERHKREKEELAKQQQQSDEKPPTSESPPIMTN